MPPPSQVVRPKAWIDSGAYSAFTKGETIQLGQYCAWLLENCDFIDYYAVLDVITSAAKTWEAQLEMEKWGLDPVPCFHYGEDTSYLARYLDKYDYIALGGMVPISTPQLIPWLDHIWGTFLTDRVGKPTVKVHGFGLTTFSLVQRYPWFSVDSSAWLQRANFGKCLFVDAKGGVMDTGISDKSPMAGKRGQHITTQTPAAQAALELAIAEAGFTVANLRNSYNWRRKWNAYVYQQFAARCPYRKFSSPNMDLFASLSPQHRRARPNVEPWPQLELYLAGNIGPKMEGHLFGMNSYRLYSYHFVRNSGGRRDWTQRVACCNGAPIPTMEEVVANAAEAEP